METTQADLDYALNMLGTYTKLYAKAELADDAAETRTQFDNMCFWQNQVTMCARDLAKQEAR